MDIDDKVTYDLFGNFCKRSIQTDCGDNENLCPESMFYCLSMNEYLCPDDNEEKMKEECRLPPPPPPPSAPKSVPEMGPPVAVGGSRKKTYLDNKKDYYRLCYGFY